MLSLPTPRTTRQLTTYDARTRSKTVTIQPGESRTIGRVRGPGYLSRLWLTFPGWFWAHWEPHRPVDQGLLKAIIITIYIDDADQPQVCAPAADLFGIGLCQLANFAATRLGSSSGGFYLNFPMPFRTSLRIEVENRHPTMSTELFCNALYQCVDDLNNSPTFHAFFATGRSNGDAAQISPDVTVPGRYVGCTLACQSKQRNDLSFLEAPEHVYLDDTETPTIVGTGMEDYFLGGWYFREGAFTGPDHGVTVKDALSGSVSMYRIHDADSIYFSRRFSLEFRNPRSPDQQGPYAFSAVTFFYLDGCHEAPQIPAIDELQCWYRTRDTDHQSIP